MHVFTKSLKECQVKMKQKLPIPFNSMIKEITERNNPKALP